MTDIASHKPLSRLLPEPVAAKVPEITVLFWLIKVLTTGAGEALSDYLAHLNVALALVVGVGGFSALLLIQLRSRRYRTVVYWATVAAVAVFGTMVADGVHLIGLPYLATAGFYLLVTAGLLGYWWKSEGTLSIHSITTRRRELLYWSTVLATFALGTALGDLTAKEFQLGYRDSVLVFAVAIAVPALAWRFLRLNSVIAFWLAYVFTRPLGASIADWAGKPVSKGSNLGLGDGTVSAIAAVAIVALVGLMAIRGKDVQPPLPQEPTSLSPAGQEAGVTA